MRQTERYEARKSRSSIDDLRCHHDGASGDSATAASAMGAPLPPKPTPTNATMSGLLSPPADISVSGLFCSQLGL